MEYVYKGQVGIVLYIKVSGELDISNIDTISFKAKDPDGTTYTLGVAEIYDSDEQIFKLDIGTEWSFDEAGIWKIWPYFVTTDDRTPIGQPDTLKVLEEGDSIPD